MNASMTWEYTEEIRSLPFFFFKFAHLNGLLKTVLFLVIYVTSFLFDKHPKLKFQKHFNQSINQSINIIK